MISCIVPGGGTEDLVPVLGDDNRVGVQGAGSPRPRRLAQPAEWKMGPSRCMSAPGSAGRAGRIWTGTSTRRWTSRKPPGWRW